MKHDDDLAQDFARAIGPLAPRSDVRTRLLASLETTPQAVDAPARRPWALGAAAAAVLLGVVLWLGSRSDERPLESREPAAARLPWEESPEVAKQRAKNLAAYDRIRASLHETHKGKWACIGWSGVASIVESADAAFEMAGKDPYRHVFVFRVGDEGPREEPFFTQWYSPRFSGGALPEALGADWTLGFKSRLRKAGKPEQHGIGPVFPRLRFDLEGPRIGERGPRLEGAEVFVGTVGPPLMLTPEDAMALHLARTEIPGEVTVWERFKCRQALVKVSVAGWNEPQIVTALWPIEPRAWLTGLARERDRFWEVLGGTLGEMALAASPMVPGVDQPWILFGRDRVLVRGATPDAVLRSIDADPEPTYHRFLLQWPLEEPLVLDDSTFFDSAEHTINGYTVRGRGSAPFSPEPRRFVLVDAADAERLGLDAHAETPREMVLQKKDGGRVPLRGGWAWLGPPPPDGQPVKPERQSAFLVVWPVAPPPPAPAPDPYGPR